MPSRKERLKALAARSPFHVNAMLVQPGRLAVVIDGVEKHLELRMMEVLVMLADHAAELVSKETLLKDVWGNPDHYDNVVEKTISQLRLYIGDDARTPRYIETAGNGCYRLIATVAFQDNRHNANPNPGWYSRSPYVGLNAFDEAYTDVFFGRDRLTRELLCVMRRQIDNERRFILIFGPSGSGKTSLLRAGVLPMLKREGGFGGLSALSIATCNLAAAQGGDVIEHVASALAGWSLGGRPVFGLKANIDIAQHISQHTNSIPAIISEAFLRHADRKLSGQPHAHLLLVIDHAEALVSANHVAHEEREDISRVLDALCECPRILVVMIARSDFYPRILLEMPTIAAREVGDGHFYVPPPEKSELREIICKPARVAGLCFETSPDSSSLDDLLRDTAAEQTDVLPMLQHTLRSLYDRRSERLLTFDAYDAIGGITGALANRAEQIFNNLPDVVQASLDRVLSQLIVVKSDNDSISARFVPNEALPDENAQALVKAFINARLFVSEFIEGQSRFRVVHEALLRQWPRVQQWAEGNRRLMQARARLLHATMLWIKAGRTDDHLLNAGGQLLEALEVNSKMAEQLSKDEQDFVEASTKQSKRKQKMKIAGIALLCILTMTSATSAVLAVRARTEEQERSAEAQRLANYMLVTLADEFDRQGNLRLLDGISKETLANLTRRYAENLEPSELIILAKSYRTKGQVAINTGQLEAAKAALMRSLSTIDLAIKKNPDSTPAINEKGQIVYYLGKIQYDRSNYIDAERYWRKYLQLTNELERKEPKNVEWIVEKSYALTNLGVLAYDRGDMALAIDFYKRSSIKQKYALSIRKSDSDLLKDYLDTLSRITSAEESSGLLDEADRGHKMQINELRDLVRASPDAVAWKRYLANSLIRRSHLLLNRGHALDAYPIILEGIELLSYAVQKEPTNLNWRRDLARAHMEASDAANTLGDMAARKKHLSSAIDFSNSLLKSIDPTDEWKRLNALLILRRGLSNPSFSSAEAEVTKSVEVLTELSNKSPMESSGLLSISSALVARGNFYSLNSNQRNARKDWAKAAEILNKNQSKNPELVYILLVAQSSLGNEEILKQESAWLKEIGFHSTSLQHYGNLSSLR